jgi:hypothetical protein
MKKLLLLAAPLLLVPLVPALRPTVVKIRFAPAEGTTLTRTMNNTSEFTLQDYSMTINGNDSPMKPEMEMTMNQDQTVVVSDTYAKMADGKPAKLSRKFDDISGTVGMSMKVDMMGNVQENENSRDLESKLTGKKIVYTWNGETSEYELAFDPKEDNDDLLKDLHEDMDMRVLLPKGEVKEGESWKVDVKQLGHVISPGGDLKIKPKEDSSAESPMGMGDMGGAGSPTDWFNSDMEGEATATFDGMREVSGKSYAVIKLEVKAKGKKDLTEQAKENAANAEAEGMKMEMEKVEVSFEYEGTGELLWDLAGNHAHSFEFSGPAKAIMDIEMALEMQGQNMTIGQGMELAGTTKLKITLE